MNKIPPEIDVAAIIARLDRSNPEALLKSIAEELAGLHQAHRSLLARMHALEVTETFYDQIAAEQRQLAFESLPRSVTVDAAFSLATDSGFYHIEYDERGAPYRWTGPEPTFTVEVMVDRAVPAKLRMHYIHVHSRDADHTVQCYVDGEPLKTVMFRSDGEFEVHGELPARDVAGGTVLTFVSPGVSPAGIFDESQDIRQLGLAFRWLRIDPIEIEAWEGVGDNGSEDMEESQREPRHHRPSGKIRRRTSSVANRR